MVAPVQKDSLTDYQVALATYLRITSPVAGMFTGSEIKPNPNARSIMVPDIRVDDYIVDAELGRIGGDHYSGSEFTGEWKNGLPPIEWRHLLDVAPPLLRLHRLRRAGPVLARSRTSAGVHRSQDADHRAARPRQVLPARRDLRPHDRQAGAPHRRRHAWPADRGRPPASPAPATPRTTSGSRSPARTSTTRSSPRSPRSRACFSTG